MALFSDEMCLLSGPLCHSSTKPIQASSPRRIFPLTKSQEGMWIEFQTDPSSTKYNLTLEWDLQRNRANGSTSLLDVLKVINKLTRRHVVLRSTFTIIHGKPQVQEHTVDAVNPEIQVVYREESVVSEHAMKQILRRPFDLHHELPAKWVILHDAQAFRVYIVGHHIIVDGQSMSLISREFMELLGNLEGTLPPLAEFSKMHTIEEAWTSSQTYLDNRKVLLDQAQNKNNAPWPKQLVPKPTASQDYRKINSWATFPKSELYVWSQLFQTSWFRVATTLVGLLVLDKARPQLGRDEVLSVGFSGRPEEMTACVGQFANALPVKIPLWCALVSHTSDRGLKSLVSAVSKNISAVKKAEMFSTVEVVRACRSLNIDYTPPRVAVTYSPKLAKSECRLFPVEGSWDLFFCFLEYEEDVKLGVIYNPDTFAQATINEMKSKFEQLITQCKVDQIKLDNMLDWLPKHPSLPMSPSIEQANPCRHLHHWFDAHVKSNPMSLALYSSELSRALTYGELYASTEQKAKILRGRGVGREASIILQLRRGFTLIEWILAVLKSGAAFVYLDPDLSEVQKSAIVANCKPTLIVEEAMVEELTRSYLISSPQFDATDDVEQAKYGTADEDLAYIIYTSGSTGEPKGVMVEHGNIAAFVKAADDVFECGFGTRVLQLASFSFDASILEWSSALCTGATLCFAQYPKRLVGEYLAEVLEENEISFLQITPTALETLPLTRDLPHLRQISLGGEAPSREIFARWHPRVNLVNAYGPTEAAVGVSFNKIDKTDNLPDVISAGTPTRQTSIFICSEDSGSILQPQPRGEICVVGPQIARGYCGRPDITARNFVVHSSGVRMYRTGDRGALLEDGSLLILGRIDRDIKVRGFRIAPEEIEKGVLDAGVGVWEVSVQVSENGLDMVAFVAPETVSSRDLQIALKRSLPSYKVPSRFHLIPSLPKSVSGKIDHKAIRFMAKNVTKSNDSDRSYFQRNDVVSNEDLATPEPLVADNDEHGVAQIWQNVLKLSSPPPPNVNFFDIGGHSLLIPMLYDKLKSAFPFKTVRLVDLFHQSTIKQQTILFGAEKPKRVTTGMRKNSKCCSGKPSMSFSLSTTSVVPETLDKSSEIAITGIAGRFPGAKNVDEFFENLLKGRSGISESSIVKKTLPGNIWVPRAGVLQDVEEFDYEFWHLSREEATDMDPQQRLFLEVTYEALTDAGISIHNMNGGRMGLFVGAANPSYHLYTESIVTDPFLRENRGFIAPSISARTAYHLNISGPNITIQTNCASSTVALSQAYDAIRIGRCDIAIVGGVSVQLFEGGYVTQKGQIFSPRGECNPFDSRADGTVPADAVTAVVLKRYAVAAGNNEPVYAKILGTGIGSDGSIEKAGYQVPSPRGQAEVVKSAWKTAGMTPNKLKYAEIHGSGTPIGDALELEGLSLAIKEAGGAGASFTVGSNKGTIGNTQHASGLVSLIKLCKSLQRGIIPATRGLTKPNEMINRNLPISLARQDTILNRDDILCVSASGWGGVNSHIILGSPNDHLQKQSTVFVPSTTFSRKTLAAPRLFAA